MRPTPSRTVWARSDQASSQLSRKYSGLSELGLELGPELANELLVVLSGGADRHG